jgi:hypothetical protein
MIAYAFHFQPSEIWAMDARELDFWADEADRIAKLKQQS